MTEESPQTSPPQYSRGQEGNRDFKLGRTRTGTRTDGNLYDVNVIVLQVLFKTQTDLCVLWLEAEREIVRFHVLPRTAT